MPRRLFPGFPIKIDEFVSVEHWGARGDGTSDDTVPFQSSIDDLPAAGGIILVPEGNFIVTGGSLSVGSKTVFWILNGQVNTSFTAAGTGLPGTVINDGGGTFEGLTDTPAFSGNALLFLRLNAGETALEFAAGASGISNVVEDLTPQLGGPLDVNGEIITSASAGNVVLEPDTTGQIALNAAVVTVEDDIVHAGDTNNLISFTTDAQSFETGGTSRLDISDTGVRLGAANARVTTILDEDAMGSDSATALATQQSIKAYVDTQVATVSGLSPGTPITLTTNTAEGWTDIPAGANEITIDVSGLGTNGTSNLLVQIGDSGGYETTGYLSQAGDGGGTVSSAAGFVLTRTISSTAVMHGGVTLRRLTGNTWRCTGILGESTGADSPNYSGGSKTLSAECDRIQITTVNGTDQLNAGVINRITQ